MRHLITDDITDSSRLPVKAGTLNHLQLAYGDMFNLLGAWLTDAITDYSKLYILYGCVPTATGGGAYNVSAGFIYYAGEFYQVLSHSVTAGAGVLVIREDNFNYTDAIADPVTFTDGASRNVHLISNAKLQMGTSGGSGVTDYIVDYADAVRVLSPVTLQSTEAWGTPFTVTFDRNYTRFFTGNPGGANVITVDLTNAVPGATTKIAGQFAAGATLSFDPGAWTLSEAYEVGEWADIVGGLASWTVIYLTYEKIGSSNVVSIKIYSHT